MFLLLQVVALASFALTSGTQTVFRATLEFCWRLSGIPHAQCLSNKLGEYNFKTFIAFIIFLPIFVHNRRWIYFQ
jgi:hypothetical protein